MISSSKVKAAAIQQLKAQVALILEKANRLYNLNLAPVVDFNIRSGRTAGLATYYPFTKQMKLSFNVNMMILSEENWTAMLDNTVAHEIAHLVEYAMRGDSSHGSIFIRINKSLGGYGTTKHNMVTNKAGGNFVYHTDRGDIVLSGIRHKKVQSGVTSYTSSIHGGRATKTTPFTEQINEVLTYIPRSTSIAAPASKPVSKPAVATVQKPVVITSKQSTIAPTATVVQSTMVKRITNPLFYVLATATETNLTVELDGKVVYNGCMKKALAKGDNRGKFVVINATDLIGA
ncbi:MAG: SprT-like domain-containing protein [Culicoidibacterales bacterium]